MQVSGYAGLLGYVWSTCLSQPIVLPTEPSCGHRHVLNLVVRFWNGAEVYSSEIIVPSVSAWSLPTQSLLGLDPESFP